MQAFRPPFTELIIDLHVEWLDRGWSLCECIPSVSTEDNETKGGGQGPEQSARGLLHAGGVRLGERDCFAETFPAITGPTCFVDSGAGERVKFGEVCPHKGENNCTNGAWDGVTEHTLLATLIVLTPFGLFPLHMVVAFLELGAGERDCMVQAIPDRSARHLVTNGVDMPELIKVKLGNIVVACGSNLHFSKLEIQGLKSLLACLRHALQEVRECMNPSIIHLLEDGVANL